MVFSLALVKLRAGSGGGAAAVVTMRSDHDADDAEVLEVADSVFDGLLEFFLRQVIAAGS